MELKDIKALQDMGFTLDQIMEVYYPASNGTAGAEQTKVSEQTARGSKDAASDSSAGAEQTKGAEQTAQGSKDTASASEGKKKDSSDGLEEIKNEIGLLKNYIFKQNATENKGGSITPETSADILKSIFNKEV